MTCRCWTGNCYNAQPPWPNHCCNILVAVDGVTLSLSANYYHIRVTSEELQAQSQFIVLNLSLSRPLLNEEYIADARILGEDIKFEVNSSTLSVHPIRPVSPGRHNMNIVIFIGVQGSQSSVLSAPLTIDVIAQGTQINFQTTVHLPNPINTIYFCDMLISPIMHITNLQKCPV